MAKSTKKSLSPKQLQSISLLLEGRSKISVCEELGVGQSTMSIWCGDPLFKSELEARQEEMFQEACGRVKANLCAAVDVLAMLMQHHDDSIKFKAASKIIDTSLKFKELMDIEPRLKALEHSLEAKR